MIKADLHVHTCYSMDCSTSLEELINRCIELEINCLAIADHGTIAGAKKLKKIAPFDIIIAEEILTPHGEIMGMFLSDEIPSNISVEETVNRIRSQNGLVCIPHPYDTFRASAFKNTKLLEKIMPFIDVIEVYNARNVFPRSRVLAQRLADKFGKPVSAGSDAHSITELGNFYVEMPDFNDRNEFLSALSTAQIIGNKSSPLVHFRSTFNKLRRKVS